MVLWLLSGALEPSHPAVWIPWHMPASVKGMASIKQRCCLPRERKAGYVMLATSGDPCQTLRPQEDEPLISDQVRDKQSPATQAPLETLIHLQKYPPATRGQAQGGVGCLLPFGMRKEKAQSEEVRLGGRGVLRGSPPPGKAVPR